jgi:hypothetical protein
LERNRSLNTVGKDSNRKFSVQQWSASSGRLVALPIDLSRNGRSGATVGNGGSKRRMLH